MCEYISHRARVHRELSEWLNANAREKSVFLYVDIDKTAHTALYVWSRSESSCEERLAGERSMSDKATDRDSSSNSLDITVQVGEKKKVRKKRLQQITFSLSVGSHSTNPAVCLCTHEMDFFSPCSVLRSLVCAAVEKLTITSIQRVERLRELEKFNRVHCKCM